MAEIRQKIVSCPHGHYYDANKYQGCPYCSSGNFSPTVDPFGGAVAPATEAPAQGNGFGGFAPTMAPQGSAAESMGKTQFVDLSTPAGSPLPVVGWLVAIAGPVRGRDYRIHTGYNYIGRERGDVVIRGDATISAEKDANVTYVSQTRRFYIAHELGKNVLLVNDLPVIGGSTELHNYDVITVGSTKLVFLALCGEQFSWDSEAGGHA